jgi:hypothetical protein
VQIRVEIFKLKDCEVDFSEKCFLEKNFFEKMRLLSAWWHKGILNFSEKYDFIGKIFFCPLTTNRRAPLNNYSLHILDVPIMRYF